MILFINACVRENSRTQRLANYLLNRLYDDLYFRCMHRGCTVKKHLKAEYVDNIVSEIMSKMAIPEEVKTGTLKNIKHWLMADYEY